MAYLKNIFIALSQALNSILGGWPDETVSSRAWRCSTAGSLRWTLACRAIDAVAFLEDQHCWHSYLSEVERRQLPHDLRWLA